MAADHGPALVLMAAGHGSRMQPISSIVPKGLLPVWKRPLLHYALTDARAAGCDRATIVCTKGETRVDDYLRNLRGVHDGQSRFAGNAEYSAAASEVDGLHVSVVHQDLEKSYGTVPPILLAREACEDRDVLVASADDLVRHDDGQSISSRLLAELASPDVHAVVAGVPVPVDEAHRYGMLRTTLGAHGTRLTEIEEKPRQWDQPTALASVSRIAFKPSFWRYLSAVGPHAESGEYRLTDAINALARDRAVAVVDASGFRYFDCGSWRGWLEANNHVADA